MRDRQEKHENQQRSGRSKRFHMAISFVFIYILIIVTLATTYGKLQNLHSQFDNGMTDVSFPPDNVIPKQQEEIQLNNEDDEQMIPTTTKCDHGYNNNRINNNDRNNNIKNNNINENENTKFNTNNDGANFNLEDFIAQDADKIINNIRKGSMNAIVPRFKIFKRADPTDAAGSDTVDGQAGSNNSFAPGETTESVSSALESESTSSSTTTSPTTSSSSSSSTTTTTTSSSSSSSSSSSTTTTSSSSSTSTSPTTTITPPPVPSFTPPTSSSTTSSSSSSSTPIFSPPPPPSTSSTFTPVLPPSSIPQPSSSTSSFIPPPVSTPPTTSSSSSPSTTSTTSTSSSSTSETPTTTTSSSSSSSTSSSTSTTSPYSSDFGSYTVIGQTTLVHSEVSTIFRTLTASPNPINSKGISPHDKNIAIGVAVGLGVPIIVALLALGLIFKRRNKKSSVQNYVDSNGRETGIAVEDGNALTRAVKRAFGSTSLISTHQSKGDFDDDDDDFDEHGNPTGNDQLIGNNNNNNNNNNTNNNSNKNNNNNNSNTIGGENETGFVVNRPRPLRVLNEDSTTMEGVESPSVKSSVEEHF